MFMLNPMQRKSSDGAAHERTLLDMMKAKVVSLNHLPMLPEAAIHALRVVRDPDSSLRKLASIIERDPALSTGILRLANSMLYRIGRSIGSVDQAVVRLGMRECQNLIISVSVRSLFHNMPASKKAQCETLWRHSLVTGCLARHLNEALDLGYQGEEFSCGICHDIGRILIALSAPAYFSLADPMDFLEGAGTLAREQDVLGADHCLFGAWFAHINELPDTLINTIQYHHAPAQAAQHQAMVGLIATADHMANHLQRERTADGYEADGNTGWMAASSLWRPEQNRTFQESAQAIMADVLKEVDDMGPVR